MAKTNAHDVSSMLGKPILDSSLEGVSMKVWLIPQNEHKQMMKEMGHEMMGMSYGKDSGRMEHKMMREGMKHGTKDMNQETMKAMMEGTHHIMLVVTDTTTKEQLENARIKVSVTSLSKKTSSVELKSMSGHFGGGLTLDEKTEYSLNVRLTIGEKNYSVPFQYKVQ